MPRWVLQAEENSKIRVIMLGFRGFPNVQGGIEKHAEQLCPRLVKLGCDMTVIVRSPYLPANAQTCWNGVKFLKLWVPRKRGIEALYHSFLGVWYTRLKRPHLLHIHAIGPAIVTPFAKLLGMKVVITHHGFDYDREKWGILGSSILRIGEYTGMKLADQRIVISKVIQQTVKQNYGCKSVVIPNGVNVPNPVYSKTSLKKFGIVAGRYVLNVGRLVPEKRQIDLIRAFSRSQLQGWKLVLVGDSEHPGVYVRQVQQLAQENDDVVMTGFQKGLALRELYSHAGIFVLPSSHEGLPIVLLEALSYGLPAIASDIPANLEIDLPGIEYFPLGDIDSLKYKLQKAASKPLSGSDRMKIKETVKARYNWEAIAEQTMEVYREILGEKSE